ncbi:bifunctional inhibitor/lipid-transfer protein/seed storage 2S albumin superfamily protein [Artemisia annua]|uniref:Bifunctional inhibitor/lipid-transfer protein/seed storage 2S albumin superfamily protein n=1 Tax=Artemisia annua TaxID=35608 RepID=A0A2U1Q1B8_ARTAN|nr:bifunctional inhibitor/lipid-transfer protein/seed storage 2S albumin superfamily protein [Artemisia annua]
MSSRCIVLALVVASCFVMVPVYSQINTACTSSMISSFTPCLNFLTNSTTNGATTPTSSCCGSLKSLMSNGTDCLCLIVTGNVPFQIPINRTLAISLPRACNMPGVPLQCKAPAAAPLSPTGPAAFVPAQAPGSSSSVPGALSPTSTPETNTTPALTPESDTTPDLTPPSTGVDSGIPTNNAGSRPTLTPSAAASTYVNLPFILAASGATIVAYFMLF